LLIDGDVVMRGEYLGGAGRSWEGGARRILEKLGESRREGGRAQKKLPKGLDSFL